MATLSEALALGFAHQQAGRLELAEEVYRRILEVAPRHPDALYLLGLIACERGEHEAGIERIRRAIEISPRVPAFHNSLGVAYWRLLRLDDAIACYRRALQIDPKLGEVLNNLGAALHKQGDLRGAAASLQRAIELQPDSAACWLNLANVLCEQNEFPQAETAYERAMAIRPAYAEAHGSLAALLLQLGRVEEAMSHCRRALEIKPDLAVAHNNLGLVLLTLGRLEEAADCCRRALAIDPGDGEAHKRLGTILEELGRVEEAIECYEHAVAAGPTPETRYLLATALPRIPQSTAEILFYRDRCRQGLSTLVREGVQIDLRRTTLLPPFYLAYHGLNDREIWETAAKLWRRPGENAPKRVAAGRASGKRIRIGFISRHFRDHTIGHFWRGLIANLSRQRFEVIVFLLEKRDDWVARFICDHADKWIELPLDALEAQALVEDESPDLLFYTDLGMEPVTYALAVSRLAPVQCLSWGHAATSGLRSIDYFISNEWLETERSQEHYTEKLVRLRTLGLYLFPPPPHPARTRADFGLPEDKHLYGCLQTLFKVHPEFDAILGDVLRADPQGELLLTEGRHSHWTDLLRQRFRRTIPDMVGRVRFLPRMPYEEYLALVPLVDVFLDPIHFGGGKTTSDAIGVGTPVVTLPSEFLRGRISYAMYRTIGVLDCVAKSPPHYVDLAVRLGTDPEWRTEVHEKILAGRHRLFEDTEAVREVEQFLEGVCSRG